MTHINEWLNGLMNVWMNNPCVSQSMLLTDRPLEVPHMLIPSSHDQSRNISDLITVLIWCQYSSLYTEWSKSEREKQIFYTNAHIWNLEKWYWWNYLQGSNGDTDTENKHENGVEEREGGMYGETNVETYGMIYKIDSQCEFPVWLRKLKPRSGTT